MKKHSKTLLLSTSALLVGLFMAAPAAQAAEIQMLPPKLLDGSACTGFSAAEPVVLTYSGQTSAGINCIQGLTAKGDGSLTTSSGNFSAKYFTATDAASVSSFKDLAAVNAHFTGGTTMVDGRLWVPSGGYVDIQDKTGFRLGGVGVGSTLFSLQQLPICPDGTALKKTGEESFDCVKITNLKYGSTVVQTDVPVCNENQTLSFNGANFTCKSVLLAGGDITVPGTTTTTNLSVTNTATVGGNLTAAGTVTGGNFVATGAGATSQFAGNVAIGGGLTVDGVAQIYGGVQTTGLSANSLNVTNSATIGGNLAVQDITARNGTFSGNMSVGGTLDVANLTVGGQPFTGGGGGAGSVCPTLTVSVPANVTWYDTMIDVKAGSLVSLTATGTWKYGTGTHHVSGAEGRDLSDSSNTYTMPYRLLAGLVGKVGGSGTAFYAGGQFTKVVKENGRLYLGMNDCAGCFYDNSGSLSVAVSGLGDSTTCPSTGTITPVCGTTSNTCLSGTPQNLSAPACPAATGGQCLGPVTSSCNEGGCTDQCNGGYAPVVYPPATDTWNCVGTTTVACSASRDCTPAPGPDPGPGPGGGPSPE